MAIARSRFLVSLAAGALGAAAVRPARAQSGNVIRIGGPFSDLFGMPFYAKDSGAFAKIGYDVEVTNLGNGGAVAAALAGGSLDLGVSDLVSPVNAINSGLPLQLLASGALYRSTDPYLILGIAKDSAMRKPSDLNGKTIAVPTLVGLATGSLRAWLPLNGVDLAGVKIVEVPGPATAAAIARGTIDAGILVEPFLTPARAEIRDIGHPLDAVAKEFLVSAWYASKPWFDQDRDRARRVIGAIYEVHRWANTHHPETFAILVRDGKLDGDKLKGMVRATFATSLTAAIVQPVFNFATSVKIFDKTLDANAYLPKV